MAFDGGVITLAGLMVINFPNRTVRLCDAGFVDFDAGDGAGLQRFTSQDDVFGTIAGVDQITDGFGDSATSGGVAMFPPDESPLADIFNPNLQNSRVRFWQAQIGPDMKSVIASEMLLDGLVDVVSLTPTRGGRRTAWRSIWLLLPSSKQ